MLVIDATGKTVGRFAPEDTQNSSFVYLTAGTVVAAQLTMNSYREAAGCFPQAGFTVDNPAPVIEVNVTTT